MKIAVSGKGGAGKSTIAANLIHCLAARGVSVFAVDADPDANLGFTLGLDPEKLAGLPPLIELHQEIMEKNQGGGLLVNLTPEVDDVLENYSLQEGPIKFLKMGALKQGGSACYCKENSFLNAVLTNVLLDRPEAVVLDMSAGIEHLTRGTARGVNLMLVVTEPTGAGVNTALAVERLARDLDIPEIAFIGNKIRSEEDRNFLAASLLGKRILGILPFSDAVLQRARSVQAAGFNSDVLLPGIEDICDQIIGGGLIL